MTTMTSATDGLFSCSKQGEPRVIRKKNITGQTHSLMASIPQKNRCQRRKSTGGLPRMLQPGTEQCCGAWLEEGDIVEGKYQSKYNGKDCCCLKCVALSPVASDYTLVLCFTCFWFLLGISFMPAHLLWLNRILSREAGSGKRLPRNVGCYLCEPWYRPWFAAATLYCETQEHQPFGQTASCASLRAKMRAKPYNRFIHLFIHYHWEVIASCVCLYRNWLQSQK